ncbi:MAG: ABC transporter permease [Acidimicrobiales bacterium]
MDSLETIVESACRLAVLLAFAATGEWIAERAGTLNISVEGMLLSGAYAGLVGADITGSVVGGLGVGIAAALVVGFLQANLSHRLTANQFVVGLTLNLLVVGVTSFLAGTYETERTQAGGFEVPGLSSLPVVGTALFDVVWVTYLLYAAIPLAWFVVYRTRWGLEVRSVGEAPQSADVTGVHVNARRRQAIYVCAILAGIGGAYLTLGGQGQFSTNMTAGRGFLALAAVIFGGWTLRGTIAGCLLFGTADALRLALPTLGYEVNSQLLIASPYVLALLVMCFFARRAAQPAALARPFVRGLT